MLVWLTSHATPRKNIHMVPSVKVSQNRTSGLVVECSQVDGTSDDHLQQLETCDRHGEAGRDLDPAQGVKHGATFLMILRCVFERDSFIIIKFPNVTLGIKPWQFHV